jgi:hypothetical protein
MLTYRRSLLPLFAFLFTIGALGYSACHESKADQKNTTGVSSELTKEVSLFEQQLAAMKVIHDNHVKTYSDEMGCVKDSKALEIVNRHRALIEKNSERRNYHRMQLIHADTTNIARNDKQLQELKKDLTQLQKDAEEIKTGFDNFTPSQFTK